MRSSRGSLRDSFSDPKGGQISGPEGSWTVSGAQISISPKKRRVNEQRWSTHRAYCRAKASGGVEPSTIRCLCAPRLPRSVGYSNITLLGNPESPRSAIPLIARWASIKSVLFKKPPLKPEHLKCHIRPLAQVLVPIL